MSQSPISRRQLLKILAAAAGTAVLTTVPNKWKTPVVDVGALPAHAQSLSGRGAIRVIVNNNFGAPIRKSNAPNTVCGIADVTVPVLSLENCFGSGGGSITFANILPGAYTVDCNTFSICCTTTPSDRIAHVVAGGTATITFDVGTCPP